MPGPSLETLTRKVASYADAAALSKALLSGLVAGHDRGRLLLPGLPAFWTEHSERVTLRSWASAASVKGVALKRLGRWKYSVDEGYDRTERADVEKAQVKIARFIKASKGKADPMDEEALLSKVRARLVEQGVEPSVVSEQLSLLRFFGSRMAMPATPEVDSQESASEKSSDGSGSDVAAPAEEVSEPVPQESMCGKFFISVVGRSRRRTLHRTGECYRKPGIHYREYRDLGDTWPAKSDYHRACRACFPKQREGCLGEEETSSTSSSEVSSSDSESGE